MDWPSFIKVEWIVQKFFSQKDIQFSKIEHVCLIIWTDFITIRWIVHECWKMNTDRKQTNGSCFFYTHRNWRTELWNNKHIYFTQKFVEVTRPYGMSYARRTSLRGIPFNFSTHGSLRPETQVQNKRTHLHYVTLSTNPLNIEMKVEPSKT